MLFRSRDTIQPIVAFIVLCSIIIHGLSIPGFSLGRRVHTLTRTWSRRDMIGSGRGAPVWTNQATLVTKAEDIIINRDLEEGGVEGVPLERTMTMTSVRTLNNGYVKEDMLKEDSMTEANFQVLASIAQSELHQSSEWRGDQRALERESDGFEDDVCWPFPPPLSI